MTDIYARSHGGDGAGDEPPHGHSSTLPSSCQTSQPRRKRGEGKNLNLYPEFANNGNKPLPIEFDASGKQYKAVGKYHSMFTRLITKEIEKHCPYHYSSWANVPMQCKRPIFPTLHNYFDLAQYHETEHWEGIQLGIQADCAQRYPDRKTELKEWFDKNGGYDDIAYARTMPAPRMEEDDAWDKMIDLLFLDPVYRNRSEKNKANRAKLPYSSSHGSQSYAQYRHVQEKKTGKSSHLETWKHMHKIGTRSANEAAEAVWENIEKQLEVVSCEVGDENSVNEVEVLERALGSRRGHTRGVGRKVKSISPSVSSSSSLSSSQFDQIQHELQEANERWQKQQQELQESNERWQQQQLLNQALQTQMQQQNEAMQAQIRALMANFGNQQQPRFSQSEQEDDDSE